MSDEESILDSPYTIDDKDLSRERGIYTSIDRQFLVGIKEYETSVGRSDRRKTIRGRTKNALLDLIYLSVVEDDQLTRIFSELEDDHPGELKDAVSTLLQVIYQERTDGKQWIENAVSRGIQDAMLAKRSGRHYGVPVVDTEINVSQSYDLEKLEERFREGQEHTFTPEEIGVLIVSGQIDPEEAERFQLDNSDDPTMGDRDPFRY